MTTLQAIDKLIKGENEVKVGVGVGFTSQSLIEAGAMLIAVAAVIMILYFVAFKYK